MYSMPGLTLILFPWKTTLIYHLSFLLLLDPASKSTLDILLQAVTIS